jgi:hypothetical protein
MSNYDWETTAVILVRIVTTKTLLCIKGRQAGGQTKATRYLNFVSVKISTAVSTPNRTFS